jgi:hypothetical protein
MSYLKPLKFSAVLPRVRLALVIAAAAMTLGMIEAQTVNWVEVASGTPSARCCVGMAYDGATHSTVLFGGDNTGEIYGDTWVWSGGWLHASPATSPSARFGAGMAYDAAAGTIVLFGGQTSTGTYPNDTWTWNGADWVQQFPPVSPPGRAFNTQGMAYDAATQTVVLFGGNNSDGALDDTWTWDGIAKTWTQQNPGASPSPRGAPMAYDAATQTVVLFGGSGNGSAVYGDTWTWNGTTWSQHFPTPAPSPRGSPAMTYDAGLGVVVLFGGAVGGMWQDSTNDTWIWTGVTWRQIHPATVPPNRYNFGIDYNPVNKAVFMFGGYSSTVVRSDTWLLALEP